MSDPQERVDWDAPLPAASDLWIPILQPWKRQPVTAVVLSPTLERVATHWDAVNRRSLPHYEGPGVVCQGCTITHCKRWNGYLAGWLPGPARLVLLHVTADAVRHCAQLIDRRISLRGQQVRLQRIGDRATSPVRATLIGLYADLAVLPQPFDVRARLLRLWGAPSRDERRPDHLTASDPDPEGIPIDFGLGGMTR